MANELILYFKFNEPLKEDIPLVVDSSGRKIDGLIDGAFQRVRESAIDLSGLTETLESGTPTSTPPAYNIDAYGEYVAASVSKGEAYDKVNSFNLYSKFPDWIKEQEESAGEGNLEKIISMVSTYFDELYNKTSEISKYKHQKIYSATEREKIYPFYNKILTSTGFDASDLFTNLTFTEKNASRSATHMWDSTEKIKNAIYQNIYSNLAYILKSKGTEKSIKTLLRSYGVDENLVKINVYGDGALYNVGDKSTERTIKKKVLTFSGSGGMSAVVNVAENDPLNAFARIYFNKELAEGDSCRILSSSLYTIDIKKEDGLTYFYVNDDRIEDPVERLASDTAWLIGAATTGSNLDFYAINYKTSTDYESVTGSFPTTPQAITQLDYAKDTSEDQKLSFLDIGAWAHIADAETFANWAKDITNYGLKDYKTKYDTNLFYCDLESATLGTNTLDNKLGLAVVSVEGQAVSKEVLRTYKALNFETLNASETIQILDEDNNEERAKLKKPSSLRLMVENSMYQIVSEEMINMFADISEYVEQLTYTGARYDSSYKNLDFLRGKFFERVQNKLDVEKYIEFYKWIDSGLDQLIRQLVPESANASSGLRNTIESHILERNKYENRLPVWPLTNNVHTNVEAIKVYEDGNLKGENQTYGEAKLSGSALFADAPNTQNIEGVNYTGKNEYFTSVGKQVGLGAAGDKQVIASNFSSVDGNADSHRYAKNDEYSIYNSLLNKNIDKPANTQPEDTLYDNQTAASETACKYIPEGKLLVRRQNNYLWSNDKTDDDLNFISDPVIEFGIPSLQRVQISGANFPMDIYASSDAEIDLFTPQFYENYNDYKSQADLSFAIDKTTGLEFLFRGPGSFYPQKPLSELTYNKINALKDKKLLSISYAERLSYVYPTKEFMGDAINSSKPGFFETGSTDLTNTNTSDLRVFWRDAEANRIRPAGSKNNLGFTGSAGETIEEQNILEYDLNGNSGSVQDVIDNGLYIGRYSNIYYFIPFELANRAGPNASNSVYSLDAKNEISYTRLRRINENPVFSTNYPKVSLTSSYYGDIAPYGDKELFQFVTDTGSVGLPPQPKAQFIMNNFYASSGKTFVQPTNNTSSFIFNDSYQYKLDTNIVPFYDSYENFVYNIKGYAINASVVPECLVENDKEEITLNGPNGEELDGYLNEANYRIRLSNFIDKSSNTINFKLNGIKKLLPYNGFYPQERTSQIVTLFSGSFMGISSWKEMQTLVQPFFAPGILYNTIKAGIAVDFPVCVSGSEDLLYYSASVPGISYNIPNPSTYSVGRLTNKLSFETLLHPEKLLGLREQGNLYYLDPTRYISLIREGTEDAPKVALGSLQKDQSGLAKYNSGIENFLSETTKFFLKNEQLTYFVSDTDDKFKIAESGKTYRMRVKIKKSPNFSMFQESSQNMIPIESLFGPPTKIYYSGADHTDNLDNSTYWPYTPPYLSEKSGEDRYIEISFVGNGQKFSIDQIKEKIGSGQGIQIDRFDDYNLKPVPTSASENVSYEWHMNVDSCLNLFGIVNSNTKTYNLITGEPVSQTDGNKNRWIIQTKFETPLINMVDVPADREYSSAYSSVISGALVANITPGPVVDSFACKIQVISPSINGIWNTYGTIPEDNNSIQIELLDLPTSEGTGSLMDLCGFKQESKSIGVLADNKKISEAVVLIPYFDAEVSDLTYKLAGKKSVSANDWLIKLDKKKISTLLGVADYSRVAIQDIKKILDTKPDIEKNSITDMLKMMVKYNIPKELNWLDDKGIDPFVMYIFEFSHVLKKQDLADIWQGTMPDISKNPSTETISYSHKFTENDLLSPKVRDHINVNGAANIYARVLKVKYRGSTKYTDIVYNPELKGEESAGAGWYSGANWPYNYFSLVELVNIAQGEGYTEE